MEVFVNEMPDLNAIPDREEKEKFHYFQKNILTLYLNENQNKKFIEIRNNFEKITNENEKQLKRKIHNIYGIDLLKN